MEAAASRLGTSADGTWPVNVTRVSRSIDTARAWSRARSGSAGWPPTIRPSACGTDARARNQDVDALPRIKMTGVPDDDPTTGAGGRGGQVQRCGAVRHDMYVPRTETAAKFIGEGPVIVT